ncbi:hypothetical protein PTTG_26567 [Puccinia triticina 1-1 BBBD Race 1]|uniref:Plastocyanin-like domain-containing protein n=2 Tax=Puccinia triticina TaxID=208348 RepID=A0A180GSE7_PUCT1|nr:uncharacterized protein PtA15_14A196 [Puccinia triticina]OAV95736.1 hypothetical protein PTTG_26567 [Puccinia triticina 1-1 BBBD Race 1]WAQ91314.1 hypothetical protein PtA15_14A196 [Puccinia triticina]WAR62118.1 hypothetical protein PtB15_14B212 [Puccinia triticina]
MKASRGFTHLLSLFVLVAGVYSQADEFITLHDLRWTLPHPNPDIARPPIQPSQHAIRVVPGGPKGYEVYVSNPSTEKTKVVFQINGGPLLWEEAVDVKPTRPGRGLCKVTDLPSIPTSLHVYWGLSQAGEFDPLHDLRWTPRNPDTARPPIQPGEHAIRVLLGGPKGCEVYVSNPSIEKRKVILAIDGSPPLWQEAVNVDPTILGRGLCKVADLEWIPRSLHVYWAL